VTYGVRSPVSMVMVPGDAMGAVPVAKLPLPRWDGGALANANAERAGGGGGTETNGGDAKRQKTTTMDVRTSSTSSGESCRGSEALTPASEVVLGDLTPLPFGFDAFDYTNERDETKDERREENLTETTTPTPVVDDLFLDEDALDAIFDAIPSDEGDDIEFKSLISCLAA